MSLNPDQLAAVECEDPLLVLACPGSGKTHLTVQKISRILKDPYAKVIGVTFTRDGAKELMHRVQTNYGPTKDRCFISTFHSLALSHLKKARIPIHIANNAEITDTVQRTIDSLNLGKEIDVVAAQSLIESCKSTPHFDPSTNDIAGLLYTTFQEIMKRNNLMDFFDVMLLSLQMINDGSLPILGATHILVDEFQDVDEVQYQYMMAHYKSGKVIPTVVGDDDQTIFKFRHALGYQGMVRFEEETKARRVTLGINYRCHSEILSAADRLIKHNVHRLDKKLFAHKGPGGHVEQMRFNDRKTESERVVQAIQNSIEAVELDGEIVYKVKKGEWAILARNNSLLLQVDALLKEKGIPYYRSGKPFWEYPIPSMMLTVLRSMYKKEVAGIEHLLHWAGLTVEDIKDLRILIGEDWKAIYDIKAMTALQLDKFNPIAKDLISDICVKIAGLSKRANKKKPEDIIAAVSGLSSWMISHTSSDKDKTIINIVRDVLNSGNQNKSLLERIQSLQKKDSIEDLNGVALTTMHSSKGLEFDNVWIISAETDVIPSTRDDNFTPDHVEDERKLMYVAMTRARKKLFMSHSVGKKPSEFLTEAQVPMITKEPPPED